MRGDPICEADLYQFADEDHEPSTQGAPPDEDEYDDSLDDEDEDEDDTELDLVDGFAPRERSDR